MKGIVQEVDVSRARLRAVIAVASQDKVQCQQPGCGHSIYAAVHIVEEDGRFIVLGSTCYAKRYGSAYALGAAQYGGGSGRKLSEEERQLLIQNTEALLAHFEACALAEAEAAARVRARTEVLQDEPPVINELRKQKAVCDDQKVVRSERVVGVPGLLAPTKRSPWDWQKEYSSVAIFTAPGGAHWVRVQHRDGTQKLVPWPQFQGWENSLPEGIGVPDTTISAIAVDDIVEAIRILQRNGFQGPVVGRWQDVRPRHVPFQNQF